MRIESDPCTDTRRRELPGGTKHGFYIVVVRWCLEPGCKTFQSFHFGRQRRGPGDVGGVVVRHNRYRFVDNPKNVHSQLLQYYSSRVLALELYEYRVVQNKLNSFGFKTILVLVALRLPSASIIMLQSHQQQTSDPALHKQMHWVRPPPPLTCERRTAPIAPPPSAASSPPEVHKACRATRIGCWREHPGDMPSCAGASFCRGCLDVVLPESQASGDTAACKSSQLQGG